MLRVRVVSPASLTGPLVERLAAAHGVQNLVVLRAAVRRPQGDAVHFDLSDGAANPVFRELRELGLARHGSISVERVDATLTPVAPVAKTGLFRRETAPVWEMVEAVIRGGAVYAPSFYGLLTIAGLIGAVGILTNSQILIVGAMGPPPRSAPSVAAAGDVQDGTPVPAQAAAGPPGQPTADLTVQTVALPWGHGDMAGERAEQAYVRLRVVADLPVEMADGDAGEQAGLRDLGPLVGQLTRPGKARARRQALADLVVDVLELAEERVAPGGDYVFRRPEGEVTTGTQQVPGLPVLHRRVDPVPGRRGVHQVKRDPPGR
jgi:hypothetical protein